MLIAFETDFAHLHLGPFFDYKGKTYGSRWNRANLSADRRKLPSMLGKQFFQGDFGLFHLGWIVLALRGQPNFPFLEAIEHVTSRDRTQAGVIDLTNCRPFLHVDVNAPTLGRLLTFEPNVFEIPGVPKRIEVALDCGGIIHIAGSAKDAGTNRLRRNASVAMNYNFRDDVLLPTAEGAKP